MSDDASAGPKVLVVDDAPPNVKLLRLILKDAGYQAVEAFSGQEALQKLREERPAAMILDVRMPGMSGYAVCEAIRRDPEFAQLPVIMVTALSMPEDRIRGIEAGATDFITKPFNKRELLARLKSSLSLRAAAPQGPRLDLPGAVIVTGPAWEILVASPAAATLLHRSPNELRGQDCRALLAAWGVSMGSAQEGQELTLRIPDLELRGVTATHTPVRDATGKLVLHVLVLSAEESVLKLLDKDPPPAIV